MKSFLIFFAAVSLLWSWGCARRPPSLEKPEQISTQELASRLQARAVHWKISQASLDIRGESPRGKFRFQSIMVSRLPATFRLEAYTMWGQTAALMIVNRESSELWVPSEKVIYTADRGEDLVRRFLGVPIPIEVLGYSLIASVPPNLLSRWQIQPDMSGWIATAESAQDRLRFVWKFTNAPPALQSIVVRDRYSEYTVMYDPPVNLDLESTAKRITFRSSLWHMEVGVSDMQIPGELRPAIFQMPAPGGARKVNLN